MQKHVTGSRLLPVMHVNCHQIILKYMFSSLTFKPCTCLMLSSCPTPGSSSPTGMAQTSATLTPIPLKRSTSKVMTPPGQVSNPDRLVLQGQTSSPLPGRQRPSARAEDALVALANTPACLWARAETMEAAHKCPAQRTVGPSKILESSTSQCPLQMWLLE